MKPHTPIPILLGASLLASALFTACSESGHLPSPSEWTAPAEFPSPPGSGFPRGEIAKRGEPPSGAPVVSEWHRTVFGGESIVLSGVNFSRANGALPIVHVVGNTGSVQADVSFADDSRLIATLPDELGRGMLLLWVENDKGIGAPVPINRPRPEWLGPLGPTAQPGDKKRVFGRNLSEAHGLERSFVFLRAVETGEFHTAEVSSVEPYAVEFTVPSDLADGNYQVFVHNGLGGVYGFGGVGEENGLGGPPVLTVDSNPWQRGSEVIELTPSGTDDTEAFREANAALTERPDGGTIRLGKGVYIVTRQLDITDRVAIIGEGPDETRIEIRFTHSDHSGITMRGEHIQVSDLSLLLCRTETMPGYSMFASWWQAGGTDDLLISNVRWAGEPGVMGGLVGFAGKRIQVTEVEGYRSFQVLGSDNWVHNNRIYGGVYGGAGSEAGLAPRTDTSVIERNHFETEDWPVGPGGSRNYTNFMGRDLLSRIWNKRLLNVAPLRNSYIAHNTSKDVATQDNKGEMILFHEASGRWFGRVAAVNGTALELSEAPEIDGAPRMIHHGNAPRYRSGGPVPDLKTGAAEQGFFDYSPYAVIVRGTGFGQSRRILSQEGNQLTLDSPWRVEPDADSVVIITPMYMENIIYRNELNAFPEGYVQTSHSASNGIQYDGNTFRNVAEGNVSRRTSSGRRIGGRNLAPSYWNEFRDETAEHVQFSIGFTIMTGGDVLSPASFANAFRGGRVETLNPTTPVLSVHTWFDKSAETGGIPDQPTLHNLANIFEGIEGQGRAQWLKVSQSDLPEAAEETVLHHNLYRNNRVTLDNPGDSATPEPLRLEDFDLSFDLRVWRPEGGTEPGTTRLITLFAHGINPGVAINQETAEDGTIHWILPGDVRVPAPEDWRTLTLSRRGADVVLRFGEAVHEMKVPADAVGERLTLRTQTGYYLRDFQLSDAAGGKIFADSFRTYNSGGNDPSIFQNRGWGGQFWGLGDRMDLATGDVDFVLRGGDLVLLNTSPHFNIPAESFVPQADPILINNEITKP